MIMQPALVKGTLGESTLQRLENSVMRLARKIGPSVASVPIWFMERSDFVAYTNYRGCYFSLDIARDEPQNLEVYLAHELMHPVLCNSGWEHAYDSQAVNIADDYKINQLLEILFGYDVRKVQRIGLRNKHFDKLKPEEIAKRLDKDKVNLEEMVEGRSSSVVAHPSMLHIAEDIRRLVLAKGVQNTGISFGLLLKPISEEDVDYGYFEELAKQYSRVNVRHLPGVNLTQAIRALWTRAFYEKYELDTQVGEYLTATETVAYVPRFNVGDETRGDVHLSLMLAIQWIMFLDSSKYYLQNLIAKYKRKEAELNRKLFNAISKTTKSMLKKRLAKVEQTINYFEGFKKIEVYLSKPEFKIGSTARRVQETKIGSLAATLKRQKVHSPIPKIKKNEATEFLAFLEKRFMRKVEKVLDTKDLLDELLKEVTTKSPPKSKNEQEELDEIEEKLKEGREKKNPEPEPKEEQEEDEDDQDKDKDRDQEDDPDATLEDTVQDDESESEDAESGEEDPEEEGDAEESDTDPEDQEEGEEQDSSRKSKKVDPTDNQPDLVSQSDTPGISEEMEMLNDIFVEEKKLRKIFAAAEEFGSKLKAKASRSIDEDAMVDQSLSYGNNITRVVPSELAKMKNKEARMAFFVDLANGNLLLNVGVKPRRGPVIIAIDESGSMGGKFYDIAAGFALAMAKILAKDKRGCSIIKFSEGVNSELVWSTNGEPTEAKLIRNLLTFMSGGTIFDSAIYRSGEIIQEQGWKNAQLLIITDAGGYASPHIVADFPKDAKIKALVVSTAAPVIQGLNDVVTVKIRDAKLEMVSIGNEIL